MKPDQVSLAIGKGGFNIKLAGKLTGYEIDVYRDSDTDMEDVALSEFKDEIDDYLKKFEHTWLCLIKRERGFFEPFFHDSMVKRELFSTTSPILII